MHCNDGLRKVVDAPTASTTGAGTKTRKTYGCLRGQSGGCEASGDARTVEEGKALSDETPVLEGHAVGRYFPLRLDIN